MGVLAGFTLLLIYQLLGEMLVFLTGLSVPGPVLGMFLLLLTLVLRGRSTGALDDGSSALLNHLSLLFVPAGVGVIVHFQRIESEWLAMSLALLVSTLLSLLFSAVLLQWLSRRSFQEGQDEK